MVASVDRQPRMPMTPDEYSNWRRQLWDQRGPNVKTPTYNELLPCYKAALERCRQQVGEVTAPPRAHPRPACGRSWAAPCGWRSRGNAGLWPGLGAAEVSLADN